MSMLNLKGKGKQIVHDDPWDINPTITFRHIMSKIPAIHNPLRVIALVDNDAFYASAERVRLGLSEDIPLVVQQWQALIAVSYKAREYGIKRMDTVLEAKKKCPDLVAVHTATYREGDIEPAYHENPDVRTHKVSLDYYRRESKKIVNIYKELLPLGGEIERASIDECFFDLTLPVRDILVTRYPHLSQMPPDAPQGLDTPLPRPEGVQLSWEGLGNLIPILLSEPLAKPVESVAQDGPAGLTTAPESRTIIDDDDILATGTVPAESAESTHDLTWGDIALSLGGEIIMNMRTEVKQRLGYTTSGGIARNKVLAKLVASYKKRDTQSILRNAAIPGYWRPMPFQNIRFLGGKLGEHLSTAFEVETVGEMEHITLDEMQRKFGEESIWVWNVLRGIDYSEVSEEVASRSMMSSKNIRPPVMKIEDGDRWLRILAGDLGLRLTEAREISPSLWPKTLTISIRQDSDPRRSRQCPFPYARNFSTDTIIILAQKLWREITMGKQPYAKIHNIALVFHGLTAAGAGQKRIDNFLGTADAGGSGRKRSRDDAEENRKDDSGRAFMCEKCSKWICLPDILEHSNEDDAHTTRALEALKMEHADYHFARDLAQQGDDETIVEHNPVSKKKKASVPRRPAKRKEPQGIAKYFGAASSSSSKSK